MSVSVKKTGIIQTSGEIGANLLVQTGVQTYGLSYLKSFSSGTVSVDNSKLFRGKPTIKVNPSSSSTSSGAYNYYKGTVALTNGVQYCYSAWVYTDVADTWEYSSLGHFQTYTSSAPHNRNINFSGVSVPANKWTWVYQIFTPTVDCIFRSFHIYFANTSQTLWVSDLKLEVGNHPTPWIPNVNDEDYVGNTSGFNEASDIAKIYPGFMSASDFIEY